MTFGYMSGAKRWLQATKCPFPYYVNPSRDLYKTLGLRRAIACVWSERALNYYGAMLAKNEPLPEVFTDIEDDLHQMGGDFILDNQGKVLFPYWSKVPTDRPSVDLILQTLSGLKTPEGTL